MEVVAAVATKMATMEVATEVTTAVVSMAAATRVVEAVADVVVEATLRVLMVVVLAVMVDCVAADAAANQAVDAAVDVAVSPDAVAAAEEATGAQAATETHRQVSPLCVGGSRNLGLHVLYYHYKADVRGKARTVDSLPAGAHGKTSSHRAPHHCVQTTQHLNSYLCEEAQTEPSRPSGWKHYHRST